MKQRTARNLLSVLLALAMVVGLVPGMLLTALAAGTTQSVRYVDARGNDMGSVNCQSVAQTMGTGWYVAHNEVFDERIEVTGDVNLILADGCTMKANDGIHLQENSSLTLWAQSAGSGMGALEAKNSDSDSWKAAIGGDAQTDGDRKYTAYTGSVTINGGKILADGGPRAFEEDGVGGPGICASNVTINGGDIKAWGKGCGASVSGAGIAATSTIINGGTVEAKGRAGIGGSRAEDMDGDITINGGTVNATGLRAGVGLGAAYRGTMRGRITIAGGTVTANGGNGAGIGCGQEGTLTGDILISGGKVTATGSNYGAGIGVCRYGELQGNVTITGGEVTATCLKNGSGIGTGDEGRIKGKITISGGTVIAEGDKGNGAGIGCGNTGAVSGTITISGGHVTADAHTGIGAGYGGVILKNGKILITDGTVIANGHDCGSGIGTGIIRVYSGDITIPGGDVLIAGVTTGTSGAIYGTIEISGGDVTATGGSRGAGIGCGKEGKIENGSVIRISGGTVNATGGVEAAGIGGGWLARLNKGSTIQITGGEVNAKGNGGAAGIGSGAKRGFWGTIEISGGNVTATGSEVGEESHVYGGAGIGTGRVGYNGDYDFEGEIIISGGTVRATGAHGGAGIGAGRGCNTKKGHIFISGNNTVVIARGGEGAAGIGGGKEGKENLPNDGGEGCDDVKIIGGTVFAQSGEGACSAIGHGDNDGHMGKISIGDLLRVQTDSRTDGDNDGPYSNRDGNPYRVDERDGACMYNHTVLISACDHPVDAGINDSFADITADYHRRAACVYCGHALQREAHTLDEENKCTVCGYQDTIYTVSFVANGGSGSMGVMKAVPERAITLPECGFTAPSTGYVFAGWEIDGLTYDAGTQVEIKQDTTAKATWTDRVIAYPLWVGGVRVNENNAEDILGDGTASYDRLNNILTLNGAWINRSAVYDRVAGLSAGIINAQSQLQIVVNGNSVVNTANADYGIYSLGALSVSGEGRLIARGKDGIGTGGQGEGGDIDVSVAKLTATGDRYGVDATGNIIVHDSTVDATGGESGLRATKKIGVNGESGVVTAKATGSGGQALQAAQDIGFDSFLSIVTPTGGTVGAGSEGFTVLDRDGNAAREVMIAKNLPYDVWVGQTQVTSDNYRNVLGDGNVSYDPDTHTLTFAAAAPAINGIHGSAMVYAGHDLTVVAPEGGLTLENANAAQGIDTAGDLTLRGNVTVNVMNQAIYTEENFTAHGNLTARGMGSALTTGGLIEANGSVTVEGDLNGYNKTGYGLRAGGDLAVDGSVKLNAATGSAVSAGGSVNIAGSLDNTLFDGQVRVSTNGLRADGDIYVGDDVSLLASDTGIRSESGSINVLSGRWEVNNGTYGTVAMDAARINIPDTHEVKEPSGGAVKTYTDGEATRETISSEGNTAACAVIDRKSDAPTDAPSVPTVQVTPESASLTYGGAEDENRILAAAATVEPETGLGTLTYRWQRQEADGYWQTVASGVDMTEYAVPADAAVGEYTYRCLVVNTLNGTSKQAQSNSVVVTVAKADSTIAVEPRSISLTYNGKPQRLAMSGSADGGTMQYSLDGETWSGSVPTATNAGPYTLYYRVLGDENHTDLAGGEMEVSIAKRQLVITVEGKEKLLGEADPELTYLAEGLVSGDMLEGQLTREAGEDVGTYFISAEAIQPAGYCKENYTLVCQGNVLKINNARAVAATVTANNRTYDGTKKPLVIVDESTLVGGEMQYALGTKDAATQPYTTSIPTATDAGTYYVWYKVIGDANHNDAAVARPITVAIAKAEFTNKTVSTNTKNGLSGTIELKDHIAPGGTAGELSVADTNGVLEGVPVLTGTVLSYSFKNEVENVGKTATVTIPVTNAANYNDYSITATLNVGNCEHSHTKIINVKEATCTDTGYTGDTYCTDCNSVIATGNIIPINPDNHAYDSGVITKQPTIFAEGIRTYTCTRCHHTYTETIPKVDDGEDHSDLIEDITDEEGKSKAEVKTEEKADGSTETTVTIGGEEVEKTIKDADGNETTHTSVWVGGLSGSYTYTGSAIKPSFHVYDGTKKLVSGKDYSVSYKNNKKSGSTATITISFKGSYKGTAQEKLSFTITPAVLGKDVVATDVTTYATGKTLKPVPTMKWASTGKTIDKKNFNFAYKDASGNDISGIKEAGLYTVTVTSKSASFTGETAAKITVTGSKKLLLSEATVKLSLNKFTYTGAPVVPAKGSYTLNLNGKTLAEDTDYEVSEIRNNINPGKATIVFIAKAGNTAGYVGEKTATFTISKGRALKDGYGFTYTYSPTVPYAKGGAKPSVVVKDGDDTLVLNKDYTVSYSKNTKVTNGSTAVITIRGKGNYKGSVKKYYTITAQDLSQLAGNIVTADKTESKKGYKNPTVTITDLDGKKLKAGTDFAIDAAYTEPDENGVVTATVKGKGNYTGSAPISYRYIKAAQQLSKVNAMKSLPGKTYTGREIKLTKSDLIGILYVGNKKSPTYLIPGTDFKVISYTNNIKTGTAKVTIQGIGPYGGTRTLSFKIKSKKGDYKGSLVDGEWK